MRRRRARALSRGYRPEPLDGALVAPGGLDLAAARRRAGDERAEQARGRVRDLLDGAIERLGVRLRGLRGAADLAHVLKRRPVYLLGARRGLEVVESLDVATHAGKRTEPPRSARGRGRKRGGESARAKARGRKRGGESAGAKARGR